MPIERKVTIVNSPIKGKKYRAILTVVKGGQDVIMGSVDFGASGYSDYPSHKDKKRRMNYLKRHGGVYPVSKKDDIDYQPTRSRSENWTYSGWDTAGFWSRWLLWNNDTLQSSARSIKVRFDIKVRFSS